MATKDISTAIQSLEGSVWAYINKLANKGYDNRNDQYRDMIKVGAMAEQIVQLRAAARVLESIPDKAEAPKGKPGRKPGTTVATPEPKGPGITPLGQVTGDGKAHTVADPEALALDNLPDFPDPSDLDLGVA